MNRITAQLSSQLSGVGLSGNVHRSSARRGSAPPAVPTLVAVAHGSRDPRALRTVTALLDRVRALRPELPVRLGHIELNEPLIGDVLAGLRGEAVLVPLLLGPGHHVKEDLPAAAADVPRLRTRIAAPLGPHPLLAEVLHARLMEAGWRRLPGRRAGVLLAAAGSRDQESVRATDEMAALLGERLGGVPVLPAYASAAAPTVPEAMRALAARGRGRIAVASYFTAPGRFATQSAAAAPWVAAAPLGAHPAMARLLLHRYDQALAGAVTRPSTALTQAPSLSLSATAGRA